MYVHIAMLAAQSGAWLFLHTHAAPYFPAWNTLTLTSTVHLWVYNRTGDFLLTDIAYHSPFPHVIAEHDWLRGK